MNRRRARDAHQSGSPIRGPRSFVIRWEGWCYLAVMAFVFLGALIRDINLLMLLFGFLVGPLVYSAWHAWFAIRHVTVKRILPNSVYQGDIFDVEIDVSNGHRWLGIWAIVIHDFIRPPRSGPLKQFKAGRLMFLYIGPRKSQRLRYQARLLERGDHRFGPMVVSTRFPLGLLRRSRLLGTVDTLTVWPRLGKFNRPTFPNPATNNQLAQRLQRQRGLVEGDFYGLRDWRPGDSRRGIHWRTSARLGQLMVRQFERTHAPDTVVIVDLWQPQKPGFVECENIELAVSCAATLIFYACQRGAQQLVLFIAGGEGQILRGSTGAGMFKRALAALARAEPDSQNSLSTQLRQLAPLVPMKANTVLISSRRLNTPSLEQPDDSARMRQWIRQMVIIETDSPTLTEYFQVA